MNPPIFERIRFTWKGREYHITPDRVMMCIAIIENTITLAELHRHSVSGSAPLAKLSIAFAAVLRYAGARVTDEEVYAAMFEGGETQQRMVSAIETLLMLMVPPSAIKNATPPEEPASGKSEAGATAGRSSRRPTKSR